MFLYKNLSFSISSVISIPIMLIGINGGYFPAICRVCFNFKFPNSLQDSKLNTVWYSESCFSSDFVEFEIVKMFFLFGFIVYLKCVLYQMSEYQPWLR